MKQAMIGLSVAVVVMLTTALQTHAQTRPCGERLNILQRLMSSYGETRQSIGLGSNNAIVEVFASRDTGTWTITVTTPNGQTCLVASGQGFEVLNEELPGSDA